MQTRKLWRQARYSGVGLLDRGSINCSACFEVAWNLSPEAMNDTFARFCFTWQHPSAASTAAPLSITSWAPSEPSASCLPSTLCRLVLPMRVPGIQPFVPQVQLELVRCALEPVLHNCLEPLHRQAKAHVVIAFRPPQAFPSQIYTLYTVCTVA